MTVKWPWTLLTIVLTVALMALLVLLSTRWAGGDDLQLVEMIFFGCIWIVPVAIAINVAWLGFLPLNAFLLWRELIYLRSTLWDDLQSVLLLLVICNALLIAIFYARRRATTT